MKKILKFMNLNFFLVTNSMENHYNNYIKYNEHRRRNSSDFMEESIKTEDRKKRKEVHDKYKNEMFNASNNLNYMEKMAYFEKEKKKHQYNMTHETDASRSIPLSISEEENNVFITVCDEMISSLKEKK